MQKKLSIIIPFYNEEWNVISLFENLKKSITRDFSDWDYEVLMVNDWSKDKTWKEILDCKTKDSKVVWINLNRNYGQSIAMDAWFRKASWNIIVTLDWDWQNDPNDIIKLYDKLITEDLDLVTWWREKRKDPMRMLVITKTARFLRKHLINDWIHDSWCTLRVYKKTVVDNLFLWAEMHRFIVAIARINGFRIGELKVTHHPRTVWISKYNWSKSIKWLIDLFYIWFIEKYHSRPLHFFWFIGLLNSFIWSLFLAFSFYQKIILDVSLNRSWWLLLWIFFVQIWVLIFVFGIVIDIMIRSYFNTSKDKKYIIREEV